MGFEPQPVETHRPWLTMGLVRPTNPTETQIWCRGEEELKMEFWVFGFLFENEEEDDVVNNVWVFVVLMKKMELKMDGEEDDVVVDVWV